MKPKLCQGLRCVAKKTTNCCEFRGVDVGTRQILGNKNRDICSLIFLSEAENALSKRKCQEASCTMPLTKKSRASEKIHGFRFNLRSRHLDVS